MPIAFTPYLAPILQTWKSAFTATRMVGRHDGISKEMTCLRRHCEPLTNSKASPSVEDWNWLSPSIPTKAIRKTAGCSPDAGNAASRRTIESTAYRRKHPRANPHWRDWIEDYRSPLDRVRRTFKPTPRRGFSAGIRRGIRFRPHRRHRSRNGRRRGPARQMPQLRQAIGRTRR